MEDQRLCEDLLDRVTDAVFAVDEAARIRYVNPRAVQLARRAAKEVLGRTLWEVFPEAVDLVFFEQYTRAARDRVPVSFEAYYPPLQGWFEVRAYPGDDGMTIFINDVTARKEAEADRERLLVEARAARAEAERAQQRLAFVAKATAVLAESLDADTTIRRLAGLAVPRLADLCLMDLVVEGSPSLRRMVAHRGEPEKQPLLEMLKATPSRLDGPCAISRVIRRGRGMFPFEAKPRVLAQLGMTPVQIALARRLGVHHAMIVPLVARGRILGAISFCLHDRGRRYADDDYALAEELCRRAALALENARLYGETERVARAREELIAVVSHDLKNPLSAVLLMTEALERQAPPGDPGSATRSASRTIKRSTDRMKRLVEDLLDSAKIEAGHLSVTPAPQEVGPLVDEALALHLPIATKKQVRLLRRVPDRPLLVRCDRHRALQVFSNLLGNAIRYTGEGTEVLVTAEAREPDVLFCVHDQGPGIPPEQMPRLFERFWRADGKSDGAGLGLYIARGIVQAHAGRIWAESSPRGSTFCFTLPALGRLDAPKDAGSPTRAPSPPPP